MNNFHKPSESPLILKSIMAWLNFASSFCLTASCWVRLSSVVFSLKKKFIMRAQSGNYNYSKTFFSWAIYSTLASGRERTLIYSPLHIQHIMLRGLKQMISRVFEGTLILRIPYTVLALGFGMPQGYMPGSLETVLPNHKMCREISWKQPVFQHLECLYFKPDSRSIGVAWGPEKVFQ